MNKWVRWGIGVVAALVLLGVGAAAGGGDNNDAEVQALGVERDALASEIEVLETDVDEAESATQGLVAELAAEQERVAELEKRVIELEQGRDDLDAQLSTARSRASRAESAVSAAEAEAEELRLTYDPQIRAALQGEIDAEIDRACGEAGEMYDTPISTIVNWDTDWTPVTSRGELEAAVEECAAPIRNRSEAEREAARLAACDTIAVDQVEKNPAAYDGQCVVIYARIVQFDAATGPCSFHAELSSRRSTRWYDYDVRSTFGYQETELLSSLETDCAELDDIDGDDYIKVWATGLGSYSYDTSIGGSNTVPSFRLEKVELVRKD